MRDAGYTLSECLAALAILSLASLGVLRCVQLLADAHLREARSAASAKDLREAQSMMDQLLGAAGPFRSHQPERFAGAAQAFSFACDREVPCQVSLVEDRGEVALRIDEPPKHGRALRLHAAGPAHFIYRGALGPSDVWPPPRPERQALRAVAVVSDGAGDERALLQSTIWAEQPADCAFDPVLQDCR